MALGGNIAGFISRILQKLKESYALDTRALSLMRVATALILLADLAIRSTSLTAHYTAEGVVPFKEVGVSFWRSGYFSLFQFNDSFGYVAFLFALAALIFFCLLIGYRTRIFSVLAWLMLLSIQNRNHGILQCGDDVLRLLLFWGIFLPWGNFYSIDAKRYPGMQREKKYFDVPVIAYLLLIFSVYFFTGILKDSSEWDWSEGTGYYYALSLDQMVLPLGKALLPHTELLKFLTVSAKWLEILTPFLLFIPFRKSRFRMLAFFAFLTFQISIGLTLFVGLFYLINIASTLGLLSEKAMDKLEKLFRINRKQLSEEDVGHPFAQLMKNYYLRVARNCFVFFCMALCFIWNLGNVEGAGLGVSGNATFKFGFMLRLDQRWNMFAPRVFKEDGWLVMEGITSKGEHIDINRDGKPVNFTKPEYALDYIKDDRWRKYQENFVIPDNLFMQHYYCEYLIKDWNRGNSTNPIDTLNVVYMKEFTLPPGEPQKIEKVVFCKCWK